MRGHAFSGIFFFPGKTGNSWRGRGGRETDETRRMIHRCVIVSHSVHVRGENLSLRCSCAAAHASARRPLARNASAFTREQIAIGQRAKRERRWTTFEADASPIVEIDLFLSNDNPSFDRVSNRPTFAIPLSPSD